MNKRLTFLVGIIVAAFLWVGATTVVNLATQVIGVLPCTSQPALTGDVTTSSCAASFRSGINVRVCEVAVSGTGTSNVLQDSDDWVSDCKNKYGVTWTITSVECYADAGSPTFMLTKTGGNNVLSGNLTCGTASWAAGSLTGTGADKQIAADGTLDFTVVSAGGTAKLIRVLVAGTI